jgi:hypothetical protein
MSDHLSRISAHLNTRESPRWPPRKNNYIATKRGDNKTYIGVVQLVTQNNTECVIRLLPGLKNVNEYEEVRPYLDNRYDPQDFYLILETDSWTYIAPRIVSVLRSYFKQHGYSPLHEELTGHEMVFSRAMDRPTTLQSSAFKGASADPDVATRVEKLIDLSNISGFEFLWDLPEDRQIIGWDKIMARGSEAYYVNEKVKHNQEEMRFVQEEARTVPPDGKTIIVDSRLTKELVTNDETIYNEAMKVANYIFDRLVRSDANQEDPLYGAIKFEYYNGYLHAFRNGFPLWEVITNDILTDDLQREFVDVEAPEPTVAETESLPTHEAVVQPPPPPELYHFEWQYGQPIHHIKLLPYLYTTDTSKQYTELDPPLREAEFILSQEYVIAFTPEPRYQVWAFEKLIKLWFADDVLENEVRMIKMLVNTFRARTDKAYNRENGVKPMIVIYPRYGKRSAMEIIQRLAYWFALFESAISWKNNPPSYFKQMNDLIAYTNSAEMVKKYYRKEIDGRDKRKNSPYVDNFTRMRDTKQGNRDIVHQYLPLPYESNY